MREERGSEGDSIALRITNRLERYAFRSTTQVVVHVLASAIVASVLYLLLPCEQTVPETYFVTITSSMGAASGALLAVTLALGAFYSLYTANWRDTLVEKLSEASMTTRKQMEKSAGQYPEISRQLAPLYEKSLRYMPGRPIDQTEVDEISHTFLNWARIQTESRQRNIDAGDATEYDSFEMHLRDAIMCELRVSHTLRLLGIVRRRAQTSETFSSLTLGWMTVLLLTLAFATLGSVAVLPANARLPLLVIPLWLFLVGGIALLKDIAAVFAGVHIEETGFDEALAELNTKQ